MTPHIEAKLEDIAKIVIMPGDPKRATFIAENYLKDYKLVNEVRGMYAYTGYYNDTQVTVMASGMGIPSMGIYAYELFKYYEVEKIIRIGSCGAYLEELNLFDIILAEQVYNEGNFALTLNNDRCHLISASKDLNNKIKETAQANNINLYVGDTVCTEVFDLYMTDIEEFLKRIPSGLNIVAAEMEAFALFYIAKMFNKEAACLMTVVDSKYIKQVVTPEERETHLKTMIELSLKSIEEGE
ncbi:MAG: purine-nucleoside phosphorylase [Firmicutes bacterium]|nr:purine-nucleoside phosphorylase [Bacillota bacterium]